MPTSTYVSLATITLGSADSEIIFSSIPATYRDLVLVAEYKNSTTVTAARIRFNSDTGSNYSNVWMGGSGSTAFSSTTGGSGLIIADANTTNTTMSMTQIMDYSATDKHKTTLSRGSGAGINAIAFASRWANTAAVTTVSVVYPGGGQFTVGSTFSLYGIAS
jgi:hypothetical protein